VAVERHLPALRHVPEITVVALSDVDEDRMKQLGDPLGVEHRHSDYRALLEREEVEAVGILTETASHAEIGLAALEAGKHILIEKPLALNLEECDRLVEAGGRSPRIVTVGFNLRWHRLVQRARAFLQTGALGRVKAIRSVYTHDRQGTDAPEWHRKRALGGGVCFNESVHHYDLWRYLLESEVEEVSAFSRPSDVYEDETNVTTVSLTNGALATGVFAMTTSANSEIEIYGEAGRLYLSLYKFDGFEFFPKSTYPGDVKDRMKKAAVALRELPQAIPAMRRGGDFAATFTELWRDFADCVRQDKGSECTLDDGKQAIRIALAAIESASTGQAVKMTV
jgi:predicted dehydrogenase